MHQESAESVIRDLLTRADVRIDGDRPWDISVHHPGFYRRVLRYRSLGLGESYMDGWWDSESIDGLIERVLRADAQERLGLGWRARLSLLRDVLMNRQRRSRSGDVAEQHYDLGNDLYRAMLDRRLVYSCAYWEGAADLDDAQERKLDLICRKVGLEPGMRVLDVGCGWGSFARFAAERYGVSVVGVTNSREQAQLALGVCGDLPVEIRLEDYRDIVGDFDRIVSIGMFEHVGPKNYGVFMRLVSDRLAADGLFLLHTIGAGQAHRVPDEWTDRYIFPGGVLPSVAQIAGASEGVFVMEDWHNLSTNYDRTLMAWFDNFDRNWASLQPAYGDRFYRMWKYYLLSCAGAFRARYNQVWQIVLSPHGVPGGYRPIRDVVVEDSPQLTAEFA